MVKSKYYYFNVGLNQKMMMEIRKECLRLGISKQEFMRSLVKEYFIRYHGRDLTFEQSQAKSPAVFQPQQQSNDEEYL